MHRVIFGHLLISRIGSYVLEDQVLPGFSNSACKSTPTPKSSGKSLYLVDTSCRHQVKDFNLRIEEKNTHRVETENVYNFLYHLFEDRLDLQGVAGSGGHIIKRREVLVARFEFPAQLRNRPRLFCHRRFHPRTARSCFLGLGVFFACHKKPGPEMLVAGELE